MVDVPEWADALFRAKGIGQVMKAEVVKDTAFHKMVIGYTPTRAVLAEKSLLGSAAYFLPTPATPLPLAFPPAEDAKPRAAPKPRRKPSPKARANRGQVRPRPRKARPAPPAAPEPAPAPAPEVEPAGPGAPADLEETRSIAEPAAPAPAAAPHREGDFTLYAREQHGRPFYFFARGTPKSGAPSPMPRGYEVAWNERTRTPFLRKKR